MTKIIIDPGHGGQDPGAVSGGYQEKDWALDISLELARCLQGLGYPVELTRDRDITLSPPERAQGIRSKGATLCISNHINAGGGEGAEVIYSLGDKPLLASLILEELTQAGMVRRRIYTRESNTRPGQDYYFILRDTRPIETVIIEYGFIDHPRDRARLKEPKERQRLAQATARAIQGYLGKLGLVAPPTPARTGSLPKTSLDLASVPPLPPAREPKLELGEGTTPIPPRAKLAIISTTGVKAYLRAEQARLIEGRWYLEGRALTQLLGGRATWEPLSQEAIFDFSQIPQGKLQ